MTPPTKTPHINPPHINQQGGRFRASGHESIEGRELELRRLADGVRRLAAATVTHRADAEETARLADAVHAAADDLEHLVTDDVPTRYAGPPEGSELEPHDIFAYDPVLGLYNPIALPVEMEYIDGRAIGRAVFTTGYEGPPGCVHGAVLAGVFDQVFNVANILGGSAGPTVSLELVYKKPTPLFEELVFEAWIETRDERRITSRGLVRHGDVICVESTGVFARVSKDRSLNLRG